MAEPVEAALPVMEPVGISDSGVDVYTVSTVEELVAAIGSERVLFLESGVYELSACFGYGELCGESWYWEETYDGYELVISGVENLSIVGEDSEIVTRPRYANVIKLENCADIALEALTLGHTVEPGTCSGGVLYLDSCEDVEVFETNLYGCGTIGITAVNCKRVHAVDSAIYDCSLNAAYASSSHDVMLLNCSIHSNGLDMGWSHSVFYAEGCNGFAVVNCTVNNNHSSYLLYSTYSQQVNILGCEVKDNSFTDALFCAEGYSPTVDKCAFDANGDIAVASSLPAVDRDGNALTQAALEAMQRQDASYSGPIMAAELELDESINADGVREVRVSTVDEFLAAIDSDTVIILEAGLYDLSQAADYGAYGSDCYYWVNVFDGPGLVINGVENLSIVGEGEVELAAIPRYANVLGFVNCEGISLSGITAGHTQEPGECAGGVLDFENCWDIAIDDCRLYGCGILGIRAYYCSELEVSNTEIYDCSQGAIHLYTVMDASFENMDIHDCYSPEISLHDCMDIFFEGEKLQYGDYLLQPDGKIESYGRFSVENGSAVAQ